MMAEEVLEEIAPNAVPSSHETNVPATVTRLPSINSLVAPAADTSTRGMKPVTSEAKAELEELAKGTRRGTITTLLAHLRKTRKSELKPRKYYRRGTIFLEHLEAQKVAKGVDSKFVDTMKAHYEKSHMSTSTMIGLSIFQNGNNPVNDPFAVDNMPLEIQIGFRKKLFRLFSLQLLVVIGLDFVFTSAPGFGSWFMSPWNLFGVFCLMILSLFALYLKKYIFPLNFGILAVYTVFQAIFLAGVDAYLVQHVSLFVFIFTFVVITLHSVLCTTPLRGSSDSPGRLLSYMVSVAIAFGIVFVLSLVVFFTALRESLSPPMSVTEYLLASAFILILCLWFAYDASCMNQKLSPDEYMQGMIFFYTDMILFLIFLSMITFAFMACEGDACCCGSAEILPAYPVGIVGDAAGPVAEGDSEPNHDEHAPGVDNQTMVR
ncbi:hypothetical protein SDRG_13827 [Saprolegnia diclina VS20]|uniref:Uncharacterized protein n=1 Tax=Saprolegnia diclina (strain VS20) TaxID=1156394 RepID=T0PSN6_SAPDV|nr:hypothetical protein SDRG_13827 [Saprolegnia diclina VS20]EQC28499.1 hypothetical protein SDRG_13827 [Saprolegnia diclina VS20]|eukprot:XP_008618147.1 hypothetical protein SDRG_13827 [Saprolegnia diclina VS20]